MLLYLRRFILFHFKGCTAPVEQPVDLESFEQKNLVYLADKPWPSQLQAVLLSGVAFGGI